MFSKRIKDDFMALAENFKQDKKDILCGEDLILLKRARNLILGGLNPNINIHRDTLVYLVDRCYGDNTATRPGVLMLFQTPRIEDVPVETGKKLQRFYEYKKFKTQAERIDYMLPLKCREDIICAVEVLKTLVEASENLGKKPGPATPPPSN